jgi:drug/metabolite transporter (DMT)-like permease
MSAIDQTSLAPAGARSLDDPRLLIPLALLALYVIWGSTYLGIRFALESYPPFLLAGVRFLGAGVALFAFLRWRGAALPTPRQWRNAAITGTLLLGLGNGLVCFAEKTVSSGIAAVAVASMPLFAAAFSGLYGQWPNRRETIGLLVGFGGVVVLNLGSGLAGARLGALALIVAAAAWAFGSVWSKRQDMPSGPMNTAAQMLCGSLALLLFGFASVITPTPSRMMPMPARSNGPTCSPASSTPNSTATGGLT